MNDGIDRDQPLACPACATVLRQHHARLVCDHCGGMMLAVADFTASVGELIGAVIEHEFLDQRPGERTCPRCTRAMTTCRVELRAPVHGKRLALGPVLDHCQADGLWFDTDELAEIFAAMHELASEKDAKRTRGRSVRDFRGR
jgi:hypothetical protein